LIVTSLLRRSRVALGIGLVAAAAIIAVLLLRGDHDSAGAGDHPASLPQATDGPVGASLDRLRDLADSVGHPVYWAGQRPGRYELTVDHDGKIFIRYLPHGVAIGAPQAKSLTIGTYPYSNAFGTLQAAGQQADAITNHTPDGGIVIATKTTPDSAYIAYPDSDYQIEVYDPRPGRALALATAGAITPVG
jgi:hypothetical protein